MKILFTSNKTTRFITIYTIVCLIPLTSHAQLKNENKEVMSYCESSGCRLPKDHEAHFDPYYNGHLCENFNPQQADFSGTYLRLRKGDGGSGVLNELLQYDLSAIWLTPDHHQNGIIGLDYKRIKIHIHEVKKDTQDARLYHVKGTSNVSGNICDFTGQIRLLKALPPGEESEYENSGELFVTYTFYEDKTQKHVGVFKGVFEAFYYLDKDKKRGFIDESAAVADGYFNRTYVGTWTGYDSKTPKKVIWGDYRLPFTFDFDCGDGEMMICEKYVHNGWASFNSGEEYVFVDNKAVIKDKWWMMK
jgi:hypothetical protein